MGKNIADLAKHMNELSNENHKLVLIETSELTKEEADQLTDALKENYPRKYITGTSIQTAGKKDSYTVSIRRT